MAEHNSTEVTLTAEELTKAKELFSHVSEAFHKIWVALETVHACDTEEVKFTDAPELREMVIAQGLKAASEVAEDDLTELTNILGKAHRTEGEKS